MSSPRHIPALAATIAATCIALPAATAQGQSGGATPQTTPAPAAPDTGAVAPTPAAPAPPITYGELGQPSLMVPPAGLMHRTVHLRGTLPHAARRTLVLQWRDPRRGWRVATRARVRSTTRYLVRWRPPALGNLPLRVLVADRRGHARASAAAPTATLTVYKATRASYYGPGFYDKQTACGQILTPFTLGVAHRGLPCGTLVRITYANRTATVPVIDRGPFANHANYDLTAAAAALVGFSGVDTIGVLPTGPPPA